MEKRIIWDKPAIDYFRDALSYIRKDSPQNADKIKAAVLEAITKLSKRSQAHPT